MVSRHLFLLGPPMIIYHVRKRTVLFSVNYPEVNNFTFDFIGSCCRIGDKKSPLIFSGSYAFGETENFISITSLDDIEYREYHEDDGYGLLNIFILENDKMFS